VSEKKQWLTMLTKGSHSSVASEVVRERRAILGTPSLNWALSGGAVYGNTTCWYGPEQCLSGDTFIRYEVRDQNGKRQNHKGGTIEHLYQLFHRLGDYPHQYPSDFVFYVNSINEGNWIIQNKILDVVLCGEKDTFLLKTSSGKEIISTKEHKFYVGGLFSPLADLKVGDCVYIHHNAPFVSEDKIESISYFGKIQTFDIKCQFPYNNYIANGIVVHNSGKSLITMLGAAAVHRDDPDAFVVLNSSEMRSPSPEKIAALGVDPARLIVRKYNTIHDIFDWIASPDEKFKLSTGESVPGLLFMLKEGVPVKGLITDSIKAIRGPREIGSESAEKDIMGDLSKFLNPALRLILPVIRDYKMLNQFVQQVNMNMSPDEVKYQNKKYVLPSGMSLRHFCETMALVERVERKDAKLFDETKSGVRDSAILQIGHTVRVKIEKANLDTPFREAEFHINYNKGVVDLGFEVAQLGMNMGVIIHPKNDKGSDIVNQWMFKDKKWIGFEKCVAELEENPELRRQVMSEIYDADKS
jgi:RecA/RadA recombinase